MSLKSFFKKIDDAVSVFDVRTYGYKVNRWLTNGAFFLLVLLLLVVVVVDGGGSLTGDTWVECVGPDSCVNPFYVDPSVEFYVVDTFADCDVFACEREYLQAGEVLGYKPSWLARHFSFFTLFIFFGGLLLNHLLYNKDFKGFRKNEKY